MGHLALGLQPLAKIALLDHPCVLFHLVTNLGEVSGALSNMTKGKFQDECSLFLT